MNLGRMMMHADEVMQDLEPLTRAPEYDLAKDVRDVLWAEMKAQGLNQSRLGRRSGMTQSNVSNFMRMERVPSLEQLQRLAHAMGRRVVITLVDE